MATETMKPRNFYMDNETHTRLVDIAKKLRMSQAGALRFIINQVDDSFLPFITLKCTKEQGKQEGATS